MFRAARDVLAIRPVPYWFSDAASMPIGRQVLFRRRPVTEQHRQQIIVDINTCQLFCGQYDCS